MAENKNLNDQNIIGAIEALLFVYGEPMEIKKIAKILNAKEEIVKSALNDLAMGFDNQGRGLKLIFSPSGKKDSSMGERVQLVTRPEFSSLLENFIKEEFKEQLSPASLEALALISYLGPLSRAQIDYYRGVNSSFILRSLLIRGLIERFTDTQRSNVYLYQPSFDLLKYLGMSKVEDLPEYEKYKINANISILPSSVSAEGQANGIV